MHPPRGAGGPADGNAGAGAIPPDREGGGGQAREVHPAAPAKAEGRPPCDRHQSGNIHPRPIGKRSAPQGKSQDTFHSAPSRRGGRRVFRTAIPQDQGEGRHSPQSVKRCVPNYPPTKEDRIKARQKTTFHPFFYIFAFRFGFPSRNPDVHISSTLTSNFI